MKSQRAIHMWKHEHMTTSSPPRAARAIPAALALLVTAVAGICVWLAAQAIAFVIGWSASITVTTALVAAAATSAVIAVRRNKRRAGAGQKSP